MKETRIHSQHIKAGAKMIDFFGWDMPLEYTGILDEHMAVREKAGLFDVSHMGEIIIEGPEALDFVQHLTPNNAARLEPGKAQYSALTTPKGTFVDDLLVYCLEKQTRYLLVVNASNVEKDFSWVSRHSGEFDVRVENQSSEYTQLALQGPLAERILQPLTDVDLGTMKAFNFEWGTAAGLDCLISRTGYTGEDGFEIYTKVENPSEIWERILHQGEDFGVKPIGLGARDTLRLEACLMLYGNDIDDTTTVLEAGLNWLIKFKKGEFLGRETLLLQKENGVARRISGFEITGRGIARPHYPVFINGMEVSEVASGTFAPFVKKSIGLAYLPIENTQPGTAIEIGIRDRRVEAEVVPIPFYKREQG